MFSLQDPISHLLVIFASFSILLSFQYWILCLTWGFLKLALASKWKPMIKNLQDFFCELNLFERIFYGELLYSLRD